MGNPLESLARADSAGPTSARRKEIASLDRKRHRERLGQFILEGWRSLESALDGRAELTEIFLARDADADSQMLQRIDASGAPVFELTSRLERQFADTTNPQGVIAVARIPEPADGTLATAERVLVLDGVQDPGNVGTLVRTAAWFGIEAVVSLAGTADFFGPKVVRATMGGLWDVALLRLTSLGNAGEAAGRVDYAVWGADTQGTPVDDWRPVPPSMLVIGSEAHGLSSDVRDLLTGRVCIPRRGNSPAAESLNAAMAGAILMYAWTA